MKTTITLLLFILIVVLFTQCETKMSSAVSKAITDITSISAVLNGKVTDGGGGDIQRCGFYWAASDAHSLDYTALTGCFCSFCFILCSLH